MEYWARSEALALYWVSELHCIEKYRDIALGSCSEFHSCYESCKQADQITVHDYERLDQLHYKVENELPKLIESLQKKAKK
jgi:hypothetical protein